MPDSATDRLMLPPLISIWRGPVYGLFPGMQMLHCFFDFPVLQRKTGTQERVQWDWQSSRSLPEPLNTCQ